MIVLTQADKVVLSKALSLEHYGYYGLATVLASGLFVIINPLFVAIWPRLSIADLKNDTKALEKAFHFYSQLIAVLLFPVGCVAAIFSQWGWFIGCMVAIWMRPCGSFAPNFPKLPTFKRQTSGHFGLVGRLEKPPSYSAFPTKLNRLHCHLESIAT